MSIRTIIVVIVAALCGLSAAVGIMTLLQTSNQAKNSPLGSVIIAKVDLDLGQLIEENVVSKIEWHSEKLPPGAFSSVDEVKGRYAVGAILAGEVVSKARTADSPTMLQPQHGMRATTIKADTVSSSLGNNLVPGNRVDIIWGGKIDGQSVSIRLLQNVKILAIGRLADDLNKNVAKSITLELKPNMDQDVQYAQDVGDLSLSLRNASDNDGVEPIELNNLTKLIAEKTAEREEKLAQSNRPTASEELVKSLQDQIAGLEQRLNNPPETAKPVVDRTAFSRIGKGMRAITIQTPTESTALAGLLEPGDRVDLHLNIAGNKNLGAIINQRGAERLAAASETLIENIEVLAVDTQLYTVDKEGERKMSDSVTLVVKEEMQHEIARAGQIGILVLTLRGELDRIDGPPRTVMTVDQFVASYLPIADGVPLTQEPLPSIRTYRGTAAQEVPFSAKRPGRVATPL